MLATNIEQTPEKMPTPDMNPGKVLLTLYDAAIRFVELAGDQISQGNATSKEVSLGKAYAIISEFMNSLDHEQAPELCENLEGIYGFMLSQLNEANNSMDAKPLGPVVTQLRELRDAWIQAVAEASA